MYSIQMHLFTSQIIEKQIAVTTTLLPIRHSTIFTLWSILAYIRFGNVINSVDYSRIQTVRLWDATTGTERRVLKGHSDFVFAVAFSPDGRLVTSGSGNNRY